MEKDTLQKETVHQLSNLAPYSDEKVTKTVIAQKGGGDLLILAFKNGQELKPHQVSTDAIVQVLEGKCTITIDGKPHHLKAGELIIMPANITHAVKSDGDFKMILARIKE